MLVIHIGLPKAGSATLQTFLTTNEAALRRNSIDYVKLGRYVGRESIERSISAHHNFANELKDRKSLFRPEVGSIGELSDYIGDAPFETMIVSSEMFENCTSANVNRFRDVLSTSDQPVLIVMIVRDFTNVVPSSYAQKIKRGFNTYDFDTFFDNRVSQERADYFNTANSWAEGFGWENMRVRLLDSSHLVNGNLIDDFLASIGVGADDPEIRSLPRQERVNESSGWKTLEATRALFSGRHGLEVHHPLSMFVAGGAGGLEKRNLRRADGKRFEKVAVDVADRKGWKDRGRYLTRLQAQRCLDIYENSLRRLNEALPQPLPPAVGLDERGFVERGFLPDVTHIEPSELRAFYDEAWSELSKQGNVGGLAKRKNTRSINDGIIAPHSPRRAHGVVDGSETRADAGDGAPLAGPTAPTPNDKAARQAARAARKAAKADKRRAEGAAADRRNQ
jgi:hypothetical protein